MHVQGLSLITQPQWAIAWIHRLRHQTVHSSRSDRYTLSSPVDSTAETTDLHLASPMRWAKSTIGYVWHHPKAAL